MPRKKIEKPISNVTFVHNKGFVQGLPARDMDFAEWESYPEELRQVGLDAGVYAFGVAVEVEEAAEVEE